MWAWIRHLLSRRRANRRDIFSFWDGTKCRTIDPLVAWHAIWADMQCDFKTKLEPAMDGDPEATAAVADLTRRVFGIQTYDDGQGLTQIEVLEVLGRFLLFMRELKKKHARMRTPLLPTDSTSSETQDDSTTPPAPGSSSTRDGSANDAHT